MIINYYYLALMPFAFAFHKFPLKNIIIGRAVFSTIVDSLNTEICNTSSVCVAMLNIDDRCPLQIVYIGTMIYLINFVFLENVARDEEKKLHTFIEYSDGRRLANSLLVIWAILFTKNVGIVV